MSGIVYTPERNMAVQFEELRKAAPHRCLGGWSCESHVMEPMGHEIDGVECGGAGQPCPDADGPGFPDCPSSIETPPPPPIPSATTDPGRQIKEGGWPPSN